jgi:hypothetical protein
MRRRDKIAKLFCAEGAGPESIEPQQHGAKWIPVSMLRIAPGMTAIAFSSEVETGSCEENA